jgi:hypothetical protein
MEAGSAARAWHVDLVEAVWAARAGRGSASSLASARANIEKAVALAAQSAEVMLTAAEVYLQIATARRSPAVIDQGLAYLDRAVAASPRLRKAEAVRAQLLRLRASD